jgi:hypothetical protein
VATDVALTIARDMSRDDGLTVGSRRWIAVFGGSEKVGDELIPRESLLLYELSVLVGFVRRRS